VGVGEGLGIRGKVNPLGSPPVGHPTLEIATAGKPGIDANSRDSAGRSNYVQPGSHDHGGSGRTQFEKGDLLRRGKSWTVTGCHAKAEQLDDSSGNFGMFVKDLICLWIKGRQAERADPDD